MRLYIALFILGCCLVVPALADDPDTVPTRVTKIEIDNQAMTKRVAELEKANFVLHEDLARAHLDLTLLLDTLQTTLKALDTKTTTQSEKRLQELAALRKQIEEESASRAGLEAMLAAMKKEFAALRGTIPAALQQKLNELEQRIKDMSLNSRDIVRVLKFSEGWDPESLDGVEVYRLRLVNDAQGSIAVSRDNGFSWEQVGHVLSPVEKLSAEEKRPWSPIRVVASTGVNSIAIRTDNLASPATTQGAKTDVIGQVFTILPKRAPAASSGRNAPPASSLKSVMQTDIKPGEGIFGDVWVPISGNPVFLETPGTSEIPRIAGTATTPAQSENPAGLTRIPQGYTPKRGDVLVIRVMQPKNSPQGYIFENHFGGAVTEWGWDDSKRTIGEVLMPVCGIGHIEETAFADAGRLSSSMNGKLDISVAPTGKVGGFSVLLCEKGMTADMMRARALPECMVVGQFDSRDPSWAGMAPLFLGYLHPRWSQGDFDKKNDWLEKVTARVQIDICLDNSMDEHGNPAWIPMPRDFIERPALEWNTALAHVTQFRLLLPVPPRTKESETAMN